jgi:NADPH-dependent 2,4-dienoyl-CoA reductase/sulfur reductase-like enzyme
LPVSGKRVVVAGSGPLLLAVAGYLSKRGAQVLAVAEQTPRSRVMRFAWSLIRQSGKAMQAVRLKRELRGIRYFFDCWPARADGDEKLQSVTLREKGRTRRIECDYLACGFHLVPNLELASLLGCELRDGSAVVNEFQETSVEGIYCAGEATGIGGLELSLIEGRIAGLAAAGRRDEARKLFVEREGHRRFADSLNRAFALRDELKSLPDAQTIVCRCEDVNFERLKEHDSWRAAKLQTRCGMGPCQARVCGPAVEFLFGWRVESMRPPVFPVRLGSLAQTSAASVDEAHCKDAQCVSSPTVREGLFD